MEISSNGTQRLSERAMGKQRIPVVHVETRLLPKYNVNLKQVKEQVRAFIQQLEALQSDSFVGGWESDSLLGESVESIRICESSAGAGVALSPRLAEIAVYVYIAASEDDVDDMELEGDEEGNEEVMAATMLELPNATLEGVWESLVYEDDVKTRLLQYISTTLLFSDAKVDFNLISWNRLVLLHGPPGTGKTSLCRALAQKLAIRLSDRYTSGKLIEINSHSLFSKWFSESGKLVQKLFSMVHEMVEEEETLVVILIDEVESLTTSRSSSLSGSEPGDAVRVVNALLTQLDKLKQKSNVLVMTTSNLSNSIDNAFMDRADIKQYIGPPPAEAIYAILRSCLTEMMRVNMIAREELVPWNVAIGTPGPSQYLAILAERCKGFSGRTLRRLPVLAHAKVAYHSINSHQVPLSQWLVGLDEAIEDIVKGGAMQS